MSCLFIPPYLLQRIIENVGEDDVRSLRSRNTLLVDERLRTARRSRLQPPPATPSTTEARRTIHDAHNTEELPGDLVRDGDRDTGDAAIDGAWASSAAVWDLFDDVYDRESVDGSGAPVIVTVHYGTDYDNAFWNGTQLVFGDGDDEVFYPLTEPMDVMAHEFTHGVTEHSAGLSYDGQPGALNESVSDVFAAICKQRSLGQTVEQADWLIGEGLFRPGIRATALRSMKEPGTAYDDPRLGKDPQVGSMDDYVETAEDNGGVHINSGIANRAFHLAATGLGGRSWDRAGRIWYRALTGGQVQAGTDFAGFAQATVAAAGELYGDDPQAIDTVRRAWTEVGVLGASGAEPAPGGLSRAATGTLAIRRHGGFIGVPRTAEIDLESDIGRRLGGLLDRFDLSTITRSAPQPDRYTYTVRYGDREITVAEQDLPPDLHQLLSTALRGPRRGTAGPGGGLGG